MYKYNFAYLIPCLFVYGIIADEDVTEHISAKAGKYDEPVIDSSSYIGTYPGDSSITSITRKISSYYGREEAETAVNKMDQPNGFFSSDGDSDDDLDDEELLHFNKNVLPSFTWPSNNGPPTFSSNNNYRPPVNSPSSQVDSKYWSKPNTASLEINNNKNSQNGLVVDTKANLHQHPEPVIGYRGDLQPNRNKNPNNLQSILTPNVIQKVPQRVQPDYQTHFGSNKNPYIFDDKRYPRPDNTNSRPNKLPGRVSTGDERLENIPFFGANQPVSRSDKWDNQQSQVGDVVTFDYNQNPWRPNDGYFDKKPIGQNEFGDVATWPMYIPTTTSLPFTGVYMGVGDNNQGGYQDPYHDQQYSNSYQIPYNEVLDVVNLNEWQLQQLKQFLPALNDYLLQPNQDNVLQQPYSQVYDYQQQQYPDPILPSDGFRNREEYRGQENLNMQPSQHQEPSFWQQLQQKKVQQKEEQEEIHSKSWVAEKNKAEKNKAEKLQAKLWPSRSESSKEKMSTFGKSRNKRATDIYINYNILDDLGTNPDFALPPIYFPLNLLPSHKANRQGHIRYSYGELQTTSSYTPVSIYARKLGNKDSSLKEKSILIGRINELTQKLRETETQVEKLQEKINDLESNLIDVPMQRSLIVNTDENNADDNMKDELKAKAIVSKKKGGALDGDVDDYEIDMDERIASKHTSNIQNQFDDDDTEIGYPSNDDLLRSLAPLPLEKTDLLNSNEQNNKNTEILNQIQNRNLQPNPTDTKLSPADDANVEANVAKDQKSNELEKSSNDSLAGVQAKDASSSLHTDLEGVEAKAPNLNTQTPKDDELVASISHKSQLPPNDANLQAKIMNEQEPSDKVELHGITRDDELEGIQTRDLALLPKVDAPTLRDDDSRLTEKSKPSPQSEDANLQAKATAEQKPSDEIPLQAKDDILEGIQTRDLFSESDYPELGAKANDGLDAAQAKSLLDSSAKRKDKVNQQEATGKLGAQAKSNDDDLEGIQTRDLFSQSDYPELSAKSNDARSLSNNPSSNDQPDKVINEKKPAGKLAEQDKTKDDKLEGIQTRDLFSQSPELSARTNHKVDAKSLLNAPSANEQGEVTNQQKLAGKVAVQDKFKDEPEGDQSLFSDSIYSEISAKSKNGPLRQKTVYMSLDGPPPGDDNSEFEENPVAALGKSGPPVTEADDVNRQEEVANEQQFNNLATLEDQSGFGTYNAFGKAASPNLNTQTDDNSALLGKNISPASANSQLSPGVDNVNLQGKVSNQQKQADESKLLEQNSNDGSIQGKDGSPNLDNVGTDSGSLGPSSITELNSTSSDVDIQKKSERQRGELIGSVTAPTDSEIPQALQEKAALSSDEVKVTDSLQAKSHWMSLDSEKLMDERISLKSKDSSRNPAPVYEPNQEDDNNQKLLAKSSLADANVNEAKKDDTKTLETKIGVVPWPKPVEHSEHEVLSGKSHLPAQSFADFRK